MMVWRASSDYRGGILSYDIAVRSKAGSSVLIKKKAEDFHHLLSREDVPANLSGASTVIVQVRCITAQHTIYSQEYFWGVEIGRLEVCRQATKLKLINCSFIIGCY